MKNLRKAVLRIQPVHWMVLLLGVYVPSQLFLYELTRRTVFFVIAAALITIFFPYIRAIFRKSRSYYARVTLGFVAFSLLVKLLPGGYIPPFFGGIAGWTLKYEKLDTLTLSGLQLVREDGATVWYSNGFTSPQNFVFRAVSFMKTDENIAHLMAHYLYLYKKAYPLALQGYFPNQKNLKDFAYPGHNPYVMLDYKSFPPNRVARLENVNEIYDRKTLKLKEREIVFSYDIARQTVSRPPS